MNNSTKWDMRVGEEIRKRVEKGQIKPSDCSHFDQIQDVTPSAQGCEDCLKTGDSWVHLRMCLECGHVGCCDNSKNRHATQHYHTTQHALIVSMEPGEDWMWCYPDQVWFPTGVK